MAIPRNLANFAAFADAGAAGPSIQGLNAGRGAGAVESNAAFGAVALRLNTTGNNNTAIGGGNTSTLGPLANNTTGNNNTAIGSRVLESNTTGSNNTAVGFLAAIDVITGSKNLCLYAGDRASAESRLSPATTNEVVLGTADFRVFRFTTAGSTTLDGLSAGRGAGREESNAAFGAVALRLNTTGYNNTAIGGGNTSTLGPLANNTTGNNNTAIGSRVLESNTTGSNNTAVGFLAAIDVITGSKNLCLYAGDRASAESRLSPGTSGVVSLGTADARRLLIETNAFKAQLVYDETTGSAANVFVASDGKMSRSTSSARYKKNIQDAVHGLDKVLQLRPVTFNHINPDEDGIVYGGLIAEEVHDLGLTEFVEYTWDGKPDSLRYGHMVSVLVKAVQELNARVVALETQGV